MTFIFESFFSLRRAISVVCQGLVGFYGGGVEAIGERRGEESRVTVSLLPK